MDFLDCGDVFAKDQRVCVATGCYNDVLVIDEFNPLDPPSAGHQRKFYSAGTGLIKVTAVGGEDQEFLDLVKIKKLSQRRADERQRAGTADRPPGLHGQQGRLRQDAARCRVDTSAVLMATS